MPWLAVPLSLVKNPPFMPGEMLWLAVSGCQPGGWESAGPGTGESPDHEGGESDGPGPVN